jgi:hypothetical protein
MQNGANAYIGTYRIMFRSADIRRVAQVVGSDTSHATL